MVHICPICTKRVNDWEVQKSTVINVFTVHNTCLKFFFEKNGKQWTIWEITQELLGGGSRA